MIGTNDHGLNIVALVADYIILLAFSFFSTPQRMNGLGEELAGTGPPRLE